MRWRSPSELLARLAVCCARRASLTLAVAAIVIVSCALLLTRMRFSASLADMLGTGSPAAVELQHVASAYQGGDALLLIVRPSRDAASNRARSDCEAAAERLCRTIERTAPDLVSGASFRRDPAYERIFRQLVVPAGAYYLGPNAVAELVRRLEPAELEAQFARNEAMVAAPGGAGAALSGAVLRDPLRLFELLAGAMRRGGASMSELPAESGDAAQPPEWSGDGSSLLVRVTASFPTSDLARAVRLHEAVTKACSEETAASGCSIAVGGPMAIAATASVVIRGDSIRSVLLSVALLYALFAGFYRSIASPVLIGVAAGAGMLVGFGAYAILAPVVSPLAAAVAAVLTGLGVDYSIHFVAHYNANRLAGDDQITSIAHTSKEMAMPIATNCLTTIFGFVSLWPSRIEMLGDFARMSAAGLAGALLSVFTLLPALLVVTDRRPHAEARPLFGAEALGGPILRRRGIAIGFSIAVLGVLVVCAGFRGFVPGIEGNLSTLHPSDNKALATTDEVISKFAGQGEVIPVVVRAADEATLMRRVFATARAMEATRDRGVRVHDVVGLHRLLPDPSNLEAVDARLASVDRERLLRNFDEALERSAFEPSSYAGYRSMISRLLERRRPPEISSLAAYPSVIARLLPSGRSEIGSESACETLLVLRLETALRDRDARSLTLNAVREAVAGCPGASIASLAAVAEELEQATRSDLPQSVLISLGCVLVWLLLLFRKPVDVALALTPLVFAALSMVAMMAAAGERLNPINSTAIPLLDGICVDAGVFLVTCFRSGDPSRFRQRLIPTLYAMLIATTTTVTGFLSLIIMRTPAIRSLGLFASMGVVLSMVGAFCMLVPLLSIRADRQGQRPATGSDGATST